MNSCGCLSDCCENLIFALYALLCSVLLFPTCLLCFSLPARQKNASFSSFSDFVVNLMSFKMSMFILSASSVSENFTMASVSATYC